MNDGGVTFSMTGESFSETAKSILKAPTVHGAFVMSTIIFSAILYVYVIAALVIFNEVREGMIVGAGIATLAAGLCGWSLKTGEFQWPARIFITAALICATFVAFINGGADGYIAPFLIVTPIIAGYFLGARSAVIYGSLAAVCVIGLFIADANGLVIESPFKQRAIEIAGVLVLIACIGLSVFTSAFFARNTESHSVQLEQSRAMLASMAEVAGVGGWELDFRTMHLTWTRQTGVIHEVGDDFEPSLDAAVDFYAPEARGKITAAVEKCIEDGSPFDLELPLTTAKGRNIWVRAVGKRVSEFGKPVKLTGAFQDVSREREERESLAAALKTADQALSDLSAYQTALDQYAIVTITDADGTITFANDRVCEISGYSREELLGADHSIFKSGVHDEEFFSELWETVGRGEAWNGEICSRAKCGRLYWVDSTIIPIIDVTGEIQRIVAIRYDITDRVRYAKELEERSVEAEAANIAKGQFLATMSHEIRTPMNGVMGMLELILREGLPEEQKRLALIAQESAQSMLTIINDVLDFSKIEAGQVELEKIAYNPRELIERAVALMSTRADEKGIEICFRTPRDLPEWLMGDPTRITQVLINLIGNALKFTDEGSVVISAEYNGRKGEPSLSIRVADTGSGIPDNAKAKLFERFVQADSTTTRKFGGSGLGLAISKQLVEMMDGKIGVESELGVGSTFWFTVHAVRAAASVGSASLEIEWAKSKTPSRGLNVLVAEDNAVNQQIMDAFLKAAGHSITIANNGQEAVDIVQTQDFDIVLMDVQMPVKDGVTAAREIRALSTEVSDIPIIAVTANAMSDDRNKYLGCGMSAYLSKPVKSAALLEIIERTIASSEKGLAETG